MTLEELEKTATPFRVKVVGKKRYATIVGVSLNDPLGVGGGLLPNIPCVWFKGGGWLTVDDLLRYYELA